MVGGAQRDDGLLATGRWVCAEMERGREAGRADLAPHTGSREGYSDALAFLGEVTAFIVRVLNFQPSEVLTNVSE